MNDEFISDEGVAGAATRAVAIEHVIVHDLIKRKRGAAEVALREQEWPVTSLVQRVVDTLAHEYRQRASKSHGRFSNDPEFAAVPVLLRRYALDRDLSFVALTGAMMETLRARAATQSGATGGHVLFAHVHEMDRDEGLLVAVLTEEVGAAITATRELTESRYLNMKGFRYAGRVDLDGLRADAERYVSFLRGSGKEVSEYFRTFLGCDTTIAALQETTKLTEALRGFAVDQMSDEAARTSFLREATDVCAALARAGEVFEVAAFANRMWPGTPQALVSALEDPALALSAGFVPHRRGLKGLTRFSGARPGIWKIEFDRQALSDGDIVYDQVQETLTIRQLPADLLSRLKEEHAD